MENVIINPSSFVLSIQEYGVEVVKYCDTNKNRFLQRAIEMVTEHMRKYSNQRDIEEVANVTIHYYRY